MSNGTPTPAPTPQDTAAQAQAQPGVYIPSDEGPANQPLKPSKYPLSSAPLPEGVTADSVKKSTPAVQ